ncbi:MAG TPA: DUF4388 domain-containing protein [Polyangiaceae bacterium]|nr:DUF4388 domain-containing protein [Polyangiaceae bacterium]
MTAELTEADMPTGFSANLNAASLSDLVQMQCLSGARAVARVSSGEDVGYLYFREGRVVHAMSPSNVGEPAALEILAWNGGSFELCSAGWPESESIDSTIQGLLLRAAQTRDESGRHSLSRFPRARFDSAPPPPRPERREATERDSISPEPARPPSQSPAPLSGVTKVSAAVRLDANGVPVTCKGSGAEELGDAVALAMRLARLAGESLGLDRLAAIEAVSSTQRTLVIVEKAGTIMAVRAPVDTDLSAVRERYGV